MKIGIVTTWFERGAAYVSRQYRDELRQTHDVYIYARGGEAYAKGEENWDDESVTWGRRTLNPIPTAIDLQDFESWIGKNGIQLVFFNEQHWWTAVLACRALGVIVGTYVDYYTEQTVPFFDCFDFLVCNTRRHQSVFAWHPQCFFVPWGTDVRLFKPREHSPLRPGKVTFFHSGGVSPHRKGCDLVLQAFSQLDGAADLIVHVQQPLQQSFPHLSGLIDRLQAQGRLRVYEESVPAPGLFHLGDVYVYPTRLEGIGLTILEAAACGLPVIVTGCEPMTEFIEHGVNGRHVKVDRYVSRADGYYWPQAMANVDDLAAQMQEYLRSDLVVDEAKSTARQYALNRFDWHSNACGLASLFETATRRDEGEMRFAIAAIRRFEQQRYQLHRLRGYQLLRAVIELRYPKVFAVISGIWGMLRAPFKIVRRVAT